MDRNALPQPEDDDEIFGQQLDDEPQEPIILHSDERADYVTTAVEISRRVCFCSFCSLYQLLNCTTT